MNEEERKLMIQIANSLQALQKEVADVKRQPATVISPTKEGSASSYLDQTFVRGHINIELDFDKMENSTLEERKSKAENFLNNFKKLIQESDIKKLNLKYVR